MRAHMTMLLRTLAAIAAWTVLAASAFAQSATSSNQIEHHIANIDGTRFHYVTAGTGDPVLLLPGWFKDTSKPISPGSSQPRARELML